MTKTDRTTKAGGDRTQTLSVEIDATFAQVLASGDESLYTGADLSVARKEFAAAVEKAHSALSQPERQGDKLEGVPSLKQARDAQGAAPALSEEEWSLIRDLATRIEEGMPELLPEARALRNLAWGEEQ